MLGLLGRPTTLAAKCFPTAVVKVLAGLLMGLVMQTQQFLKSQHLQVLQQPLFRKVSLAAMIQVMSIGAGQSVLSIVQRGNVASTLSQQYCAGARQPSQGHVVEVQQKATCHVLKPFMLTFTCSVNGKKHENKQHI